MAKARVTYRYATGESVSCSVSVDHDHPDAQDEVTSRAGKLFADVLQELKAETDAEGE